MLRDPFRFVVTPNTPGAGVGLFREGDRNPQELLQFEVFVEDKKTESSCVTESPGSGNLCGLSRFQGPLHLSPPLHELFLFATFLKG